MKVIIHVFGMYGMNGLDIGYLIRHCILPLPVPLKQEDKITVDN